MWNVIKQRFHTKGSAVSDKNAKDFIQEECIGRFDSLYYAVKYRNLLIEHEQKDSYCEYSGMWVSIYIKEET